MKRDLSYEKMMGPKLSRARSAIFVAVLLLFAPFFTSITFGASAFEVEGILRCKSIFEGKITREFPDVSFLASIDQCRWSITLLKPKEHLRIQAVFDGECRYGYALDSNSGKPTLGAIYGDPIPSMQPIPDIPFIWMALCQGCSLKQSNLFLVPAYIASPERVGFRAEVEFLDEGMRLPSKIRYLNDGYTYSPERAKLSPPFDTGYVDAEFAVLESTNLDVGKIPTRFQLNVFQPMLSADVSKKTSVSLSMEGMVSAARSGSSLSPITAPAIPRQSSITIHDYRFVAENSKYRSYFGYVTNQWLPVKTVRAMPNFLDYARNEEAAVHLSPIFNSSQVK